MAKKKPNAIPNRVLKLIYKWCVDNNITPVAEHHDLGERLTKLIYRIGEEKEAENRKLKEGHGRSDKTSKISQDD